MLFYLMKFTYILHIFFANWLTSNVLAGAEKNNCGGGELCVPVKRKTNYLIIAKV